MTEVKYSHRPELAAYVMWMLHRQGIQATAAQCQAVAKDLVRLAPARSTDHDSAAMTRQA